MTDLEAVIGEELLIVMLDGESQVVFKPNCTHECVAVDKRPTIHLVDRGVVELRGVPLYIKEHYGLLGDTIRAVYHVCFGPRGSVTKQRFLAQNCSIPIDHIANKGVSAKVKQLA